MKEYLREATKDDVDLLFKWTNDPAVRKNSFSSEKITYEEHTSWYRSLLENKNCKQYIYMCGDCPIGQIRIVQKEKNAEISYSICTEKRSQGYGAKMLELVKNQVFKDFPMVDKLTGLVKTDNLASKKAFENAGYEEKYSMFEFVRMD